MIEIDIINRLDFDATRCELQFSKGVAGNIKAGIAEIKRLRAQIEQMHSFLAMRFDTLNANWEAHGGPFDRSWSENILSALASTKTPTVESGRSVVHRK